MIIDIGLSTKGKKGNDKTLMAHSVRRVGNGTEAERKGWGGGPWLSNPQRH